MTELKNEPAVTRLIDYAKSKTSISYDEVHDFLPDSIVNSDKIEAVLALLAQHNVVLEESTEDDREEEKDVSDGLIEFLKKQAKAPADQIKELEEKKKITSVSIELEHTVGHAKYPLRFDLESQGTKRYYGFAGLLALLIKNLTIIPIDELEASLHPDLYLHFLLSFLLNAEKSQLIATTHNREILDNKDVFRNDVIWFTDKDDACSTELFSLADFDTSVVRNTTNILNAYKSGKLKATPRSTSVPRNASSLSPSITTSRFRAK